MTAILAYSVPHGQHRGSSWPDVVRCATPGCPFRRAARGAPEPWACPEHDDSAQQQVIDVGQALAEAAHRELTEPPTRQYALQPSPRLDPDWTHDAP